MGADLNKKRAGRRGAARADRNGEGAADLKYIRLQLDSACVEELRRMAKQARCSPFDVCVKLLEERTSAAERGASVCGA